MGDVDGPVDEPGFLLRGGVIILAVFLDVIFHFVGGELGEELAVAPDFGGVLPEVVVAGAGPVIVVRVVVDAATEVAEEVIEALRVWDSVGRIAEVPFADGGGVVAGGFHHFGNGGAFGGEAGFRGGVVCQAGAEVELAGHERGARGGAHGGAVELGEAGALRGEAVEVRSVEVFRAVTVEVDGALVVGVDEEDVRTRRVRTQRRVRTKG